MTHKNKTQKICTKIAQCPLPKLSQKIYFPSHIPCIYSFVARNSLSTLESSKGKKKISKIKFGQKKHAQKQKSGN